MAAIMHACPRPGCIARVPFGAFACLRCWRTLPVDIRNGITYARDREAWDAHTAAMRAARDWWEAHT